MSMMDEGRLSTFEGGQDIRDRTFAFACRVVKFCESVYASGGVGRIMVPQLVDSASSSATMLEEARAAESTRDFISKCSISLKESRETWTRLRMYHTCRLGPEAEARDLVREANQLISIVTAIIRNTRRNAAVKKKNGKNETRRHKPQRREYEFPIPNSKFQIADHFSEDSTQATSPLSCAIGSPSQAGGVSQTNARMAITHRS
jgi:four helix bundle protein